MTNGEKEIIEYICPTFGEKYGTITDIKFENIFNEIIPPMIKDIIKGNIISKIQFHVLTRVYAKEFNLIITFQIFRPKKILDNEALKVSEKLDIPCVIDAISTNDRSLIRLTFEDDRLQELYDKMKEKLKQEILNLKGYSQEDKNEVIRLL